MKFEIICTEFASEQKVQFDEFETIVNSIHMTSKSYLKDDNMHFLIDILNKCHKLIAHMLYSNMFDYYDDVRECVEYIYDFCREINEYLIGTYTKIIFPLA